MTTLRLRRKIAGERKASQEVGNPRDIVARLNESRAGGKVLLYRVLMEAPCQAARQIFARCGCCAALAGARMITQIERGSTAVLRSASTPFPVAAQWQPSRPLKASASKDSAPKWCAGLAPSMTPLSCLAAAGAFSSSAADWVWLGSLGSVGTWVITR